MTIFTTYAEKKAKQFLNLLQGYTKGIRFTAILILLLMGVSNTWAADASNAIVYYDNTASNWSDVQILIGHSTWSSVYTLSKISGTNNLYCNTSLSWGGYSEFYFVTGASSWGDEGNSPTHRKGYVTNYSAKKTTSLGSNKYLYVSSGTSKGASLTETKLNNGYSDLNYTQTVQQHLSTDGGTNYSASTTVLATVKVSSNKLNGNSSTTSSSGTIASGSSSTTCSAARTATVEYEVTNVKTGYTFVGWYDGNTQKSTSTTYTYNATEAKTITARFKENTYSVTISAGSGGTVSPSGKQTVGQVTKTTVTATSNANYEFVNWTVTGGVVVANTSSASTTITATAAGTLKANFRSTATYALTVKAGEGIASVAGSIDPITLGNKYDIKATPKTGYAFSTWTANPAANATFESATTANTNVTVKNGSVTVAANATEIMSTLTVENHYSEGAPGYAAPEASASTIGIATTATVTAVEADEEYIFAGWTLINCTRTDGGDEKARTITIRSNGDGANAFAKAEYTKRPPTTIYFKPNSAWKEESTNYSIAYWDNNQNRGQADMTELDCEGSYFVGEVPLGYEHMMIQRVKADPDAKYCVTGNSELVGSSKAWKEDAITMTYDNNSLAFTHTFSNLAGGIVYKMKLTNGTWDANWGYKALKNPPANVTSDNDNNIVFQLPYNGDVVVRYDGTNISIEGQFVKDDETPQHYNTAVPGQCHDVMLQGFYWDSNQDKYYGNTRWTTLQGEAADISTYYDLIWLPPSAMSSGGVGYHPKQYSNQNSDWGSRADLEKLISMLHAGGTKVIADMVVNHIDSKEGWCNFYEQDFGEYGKWQVDGSFICNGDEMNWDADEGCRGKAIGAGDDGYGGESNYGAARDLSHNEAKVREMCRAYAKWLIDVMKYDGFRYDYCKGFHMSHVDDYNANAGAYFSVIEYYDGNRDVLWERIRDAKENTYAFDFGMKFNVMNGGIANFNYGACKSPNALIGIGKGKWAVNFIDNHDTFERGNGCDFGGDAMHPDTKDRLLQAHAYMLSMPGVPCVFYPYWKKYKDAIAPMILARKAVGVHSESGVSDETVDGNNGYRAHVYGSKGELILELGAAVSDSHYGFREVAAGPGYKMFITYEAAGAELTVSPQSTYYRSQTMSVTMNAVGLAGVPEIYYTIDGTDPRTSASKQKYTGAISISGTVTVKAYAEIHGNQTAVQTHTYTYYPPQEEPLTVRFMPPTDWGNSAYIYAWDSSDNKPLGNWPGRAIEKDQDGWVSYTFASGLKSVNLIFNNNYGMQSSNILLEEDACYIWKDGATDAALTNECNITEDEPQAAPARRIEEQSASQIAETITTQVISPKRKAVSGPKLVLASTEPLTVPEGENNLYDMDHNGTITHVHLVPNENWKSDNARFAAYFFGNGEKWVDMTDDNENGTYSCKIPEGFPSVIFCRMNPGAAENKWDNKWNQTSDLTIPNDGKNCYTIADGAWDKGSGSWGSAMDDSKWTALATQSYVVTINITGHGTVVIDGDTYTSDSDDMKTFTKNVALNSTVEVGALTPANDWTYGEKASIKIGSRTQEALEENTTHTICGRTVVNISFSPSACRVVFNLNLPNGVATPSWSIENQVLTPGSIAREPNVGEVEGYFFGGWYTHASDFTASNSYDFTEAVNRNITLYACWLSYEDCIFFKNNLNWESVYAYFYNSDKYWDDNKGTGSQKLKIFPQDNDAEHKPHWFEFQGEMSNIPGTDIWYLDFISMAKTVDANNWGEIENYKNISFTEHKQYNYEFFHQTSVVRRGDFNRNMSLFIPEAGQTSTTRNESKYYNHGLWVKYNSTESGYEWRGATSDNASEPGWKSGPAFTTDKAGNYSFSAVVNLTGGTDYLFKIAGQNNTWFGNTGTMSQDNCTNWHFTTEEGSNAKIHPTANGEYLFTIYVGDGKMIVSLEYPLSVGDYRLVYTDNTAGSAHPSHYIKKRSESQNDTISFFVHHDKRPQIIVQQCSAIANDGTATWQTVNIGNVNPAAGITKTGVYNFVLQQIAGQTSPLLVAQAQAYTGDFYIRTDAAAGGWDSFRQAGNRMTYSSYASAHEDFDHYFCSWVTSGRNIKYTIANDYSLCISDTLDGDDIINKTGVSVGSLPAQANVRYAWDSRTNELSRAYIAGSAIVADRYLVLEGNEYLKDINGEALNVSGLNQHEAIFSDKQNWIYQLDVQANNNTEITLTAKYNDQEQIFFSTLGSGDGGEPIMQATNEDYHKVRMIYDFKTNNLLAAWLLDETQYPETTSVASNMLIIRENQGVANQINFSNIDNDDMTIQTAYAVMTFTKEHIEDKDLSERERSEYWVSFPFDVNISDVFGFSEYGDKWIMLLYDGAERAEKGNWIDSPTFWKYITNRNYTLEAGVGYVLKLNLSKMDFPNNSTDASLFFPSQGIHTVINAEPTPITVAPHECTIERDNRNIYDSHWNLIGVPGYANLDNVNTKYTTGNQAENVSFYYAYNAADNSYEAAAATANFKNMHAYMVQFAGTINWKNDPQFNNIPQQLAARRNSDTELEKAIFRLELAQGEKMADQTFVQLQQEGATADFDMNKDLTKIINAGANIYTLVGEGNIQTAGNVLPMGECEVPVGVKVDAAGEYTFRMPDGTEGMVVEFIDYYTNTRTNLLLFDYTITLPAGTSEDRFALHIQPTKSGVATDIDQLTGSDLNADGVQKYIIDGRLYLKKDGVVYDAQGRMLKSKNGKRIDR